MTATLILAYDWLTTVLSAAAWLAMCWVLARHAWRRDLHEWHYKQALAWAIAGFLLAHLDYAGVRFLLKASWKVWTYFGLVGIASTAMWVGSAYNFAFYAASPRRTRRYWIALALAIFGLAAAKLNSASVSMIGVDQTAELKAAEERLKRDAVMKSIKAKEKSEEDDEEEEEVEAGETAADKAATNAPPAAVAATNAPAPGAGIEEAAPEYAYKAAGKQKRDEDKKIKDSTLAAAQKVEGSQDSARERKMHRRDVTRANIMDRWNLFFARGVFWCSFLLVLVDYLSRFNKTFDAYLPLPIASRLADTACPNKKLTVLVHEAEPDAVRAFLEYVVRKGETFIYFGAGSPWAAASKRSRHELYRLYLFGRGLWPLRRVRCEPGAFRFGSTFVFESAWFRRYCFEVDPRLTREWLARLIEFLAMRQRVLGSSRCAVNIVWNLPDTLDAATREKLLFLCREANHRLVVLGDAGNVWATESFEEVRERLAVRQPSVLDTAWRFVVSVVYGERDVKRDGQAIRRFALKTWAGLCVAAKVTAVEAARYYGIGRVKAKAAHDKLAAAKAEMQRRADEARVRHQEQARLRRIEEEKRAREEAERRAREEAARQVREEEGRARREAEAEAKRRAAEESARRRAEEQAAKEAADRKAREEAEARRRAQEEADRKTREERAVRKAEEQAADRVARDEAQRQAAEDKLRTKAEARQAGEEAARRRVLGDAVGAAPAPAPKPTAAAAPAPGSSASAPASPSPMFRFRCPRCGQRLAAEVAWVGDEIQCPSCAGKIAVPQPSA